MCWPPGGSHCLVATTMVADAIAHDSRCDSPYPMHDASDVAFHATRSTVVLAEQSMDDGCRRHHYRPHYSSTHLLALSHSNATSSCGQKPIVTTMSPRDYYRCHGLAWNWHCLATLAHGSCWWVHLKPSTPIDLQRFAPPKQGYDRDGSVVAVVARPNGSSQYANEMAYCDPYYR